MGRRPGLPLGEVNLGVGVFFYIHDIIEVFFPVGGIANQQLRIIGAYPMNSPAPVLDREGKGAVIAVHPVLCVLALSVAGPLPPAIRCRFNQLAQAVHSLVLCPRSSPVRVSQIRGVLGLGVFSRQVRPDIDLLPTLHDGIYLTNMLGDKVRHCLVVV